MTIRTCLCLVTRLATATHDGGAETARRRHEVLLGFKKAGFGAGRWVGLGGHIEGGEAAADAAAREVAEESGLIVSPAALTHMASLRFVFPARPAWDQTAEVFVTSDFAGEPAESDEVAPRWFPSVALPFESMWDDARYWVPLVLAGHHVTATITFAEDCATVGGTEPDLPAAVLTDPGRSLAVLRSWGDESRVGNATQRPGTR